MPFFFLQDVSTLGIVNVRYSGYVATVKVERNTDEKVVPTSSFISLLDQPEGGANTLNINRFIHILNLFMTK